jgi:hypothetical protein
MMTFQRIGFGAAILAAVVLGGCDTPPKRQNFADVTFQHLAPITLDVGSVQVETAPMPPLETPGIEEVSSEFPQLPADAVAQWARDRLKAAGARGQANFTIVEARATRTPLPRSSGLGAAFKKDQSDRYDLALEIRLEAFNPILNQSGMLSERVTRTQTVAEDLTLNQREVVLFNLLDSAMQDLNARLERSIPQYLGPLLR